MATTMLSIKIDRSLKDKSQEVAHALGVSLNAILNSFSKIDKVGEGAAIQIIIKPADHDYVKATLAKDTARTADEAVVDVYKRIRPGDLTTPETARSFLEAMFFNPKRYDLGRVGRYKMNHRLDQDQKKKIAPKD